MTESRSSSQDKPKKTGEQIRESERLRTAKKRALDNTNGFGRFEVRIPKDGEEALREFAKLLGKEGTPCDLEIALDIFDRYRKKRAGIATDET
jgi:hypothetical protein